MDPSSKINSSIQQPYVKGPNTISNQQTDAASNAPAPVNDNVRDAVRRAIKQFSEDRMAKIASLQIREPVQALQNSLEELNKLSLSYANAVNLLDESEDDDDLDAQAEVARKEMAGLIQTLVEKHKSLGINKAWFDSWWLLERVDKNVREISLEYLTEQLLNRCVDRTCFLEETRKVIEAQKKQIIREFYQNTNAIADANQMSFDLFPIGSETHNRGKTPVQITFASNKTELFSIVFKPRDARIDALVIDLFGSFNNLDRANKSIDVTLPVYKILNVTPNSPYSLWEYIKPQPGVEWPGDTASTAIKAMNRSEQLLPQLMRLESICSYLNISDLHTDNLILFSPNQKDIQIVPIDLESIQYDSTTGLFLDRPDIPKLTEAEEELLKKCKSAIGDVPARFVPIVTSHFLTSLPRYNSYVKIAKNIVDTITRKNYTLAVEIARMEWLVLEDFLCNDVPYLIEYQSQIFYGPLNHNNPIARRTVK